MGNNRLFDRLYFLIGVPWLALMLLTSGSLTEIKTVLLIILMIISLFELSSRRIVIDSKQKIFVFVFCLYMMMSLSLGIILGYEFEISKDFPLIQYYLITPICVIILGKTLSVTKKRRCAIWNIFKYLTLILAILDVVKVISIIYGIPIPLLEFITLYSKQTTNELSVRVTNESSFFMLLPIYIYLFFNPEKNQKSYDRYIYMLIILFGITYSIFSGRKILEVLVVICVIASLVYKDGKVKIGNLFGKKTIVLFLLLFLFDIIFARLSNTLGLGNIIEMAFQTVINGFSSDAAGVISRVDNSNALYDFWSSSPLWGHGLNSYVPYSLANKTTKWSYEVVYLALLAQTGIIGVLLFFRSIIYVAKKLIIHGKKYNDRKCLAIMVGFISFILAGSSNPLVYFVWPWSFSLIYCNIENE
jgi:hypothetical protein